MKYKLLGRTGVQVSELCFGTMSFGGDADEATSSQMYKACRDAGINFFDTANEYSKGKSEEILGRLIKGERDDLVITTKCYNAIRPDVNARGSSRRHIVQAVEASLRRLQTDHIDLYQLHTPDPVTPIAETLGAMTELVREGKVRYLGCSNFDGWQVADAAWTSETTGLERFVSAQNRYSLLDRSVERELVPACERFGLGVLPFFPLEYGLLTGKYRRGEAAPTGSRADLDASRAGWLAKADWDRIEALESYAAERGLSVLDVAVAGLAAQPTVASVISGVTRGEQVTTNASALRWEPTDEDLDALDEI